MLWKPGCAPYAAQCGGQAEPSLEAFEAQGARGAVIVCPGGGYTRKAPHEGADVAEVLQSAGISAFVLDYRVAPCPHDAPLSDAQRAVRMVRAMGYEKTAILGFSAGGNLACCASTLYTPGDPQADDPLERISSRPDALVSCYSVVSLCQHTHAGTLCALLGGQYKNLALQRRYSAEMNVTEDTPPAFIWHTAEDASVPVENSLNLAGAYSRAGVPFEMHIFPKGKHGLGLAPEVPDTARWMQLCLAWLKAQGFRRQEN